MHTQRSCATSFRSCNQRPPTGVPAQIFDLEGQLLAVAEALPTAGNPDVDPSAKRPALNPGGADLPRFGPTGVPTLGRLATAEVMPMPELRQDLSLDTVPGGSALSSLDVARLFDGAAG